MADLEKKIKGVAGLGWSQLAGGPMVGIGSLNPKYHYEYQEMRGGGGGGRGEVRGRRASHSIHPRLDPPLLTHQ